MQWALYRLRHLLSLLILFFEILSLYIVLVGLKVKVAFLPQSQSPGITGVCLIAWNPGRFFCGPWELPHVIGLCHLATPPWWSVSDEALSSLSTYCSAGCRVRLHCRVLLLNTRYQGALQQGFLPEDEEHSYLHQH